MFDFFLSSLPSISFNNDIQITFDVFKVWYVLMPIAAFLLIAGYIRVVMNKMALNRQKLKENQAKAAMEELEAKQKQQAKERDNYNSLPVVWKKLVHLIDQYKFSTVAVSEIVLSFCNSQSLTDENKLTNYQYEYIRSILNKLKYSDKEKIVLLQHICYFLKDRY
jgi:hypothetical protein